ncbi:hypothetical protein HG536_0F02240 [Torulaspora globosa]|uniref:Rho-GAP domain-containing protein n=1 Tax=Torulaspora globosa TaxID=48254 RepID=A0A7G3ZK63_9SACH|nr:uncharacterized protein HG536_0F02240 [Torulaspora globosa]QLL33899.1 hypothetical protein HG536_0F02240 [Torulaspora globosa]
MNRSSDLQEQIQMPTEALNEVVQATPDQNDNGTGPIEPKSLDQMLESPEIKKVMDSDVAINALLSRLKQSLLTCEEFTKFIRKKHVYEEEHVEELAKQFKHFFVDTSGGSSLKKKIHEVLEFDGKLAHVKRSYVLALGKMYEEMSALLFTMTKMRKSVKENSRRLEKEVSDAIHSAEKAQSRYNSLCQDWDKLRMADPTKTKLTLRGSKTTKEQEEDLLRKIDNADMEYKQKVDHSDSLRNVFITKERPKIVSELKDLILEIDTAMSIQLQKYTIWTENLILNSGVTVTPFEASKSMKAVASSVTNEVDLYNFLKRYNSSGKNGLSVNRNLIPVKYKKHPSMSKGVNDSKKVTRSGPTFAVNPAKNSIPKRIISTHNDSPFTPSSSIVPVGTASTPSAFKASNTNFRGSFDSSTQRSNIDSQPHIANEQHVSAPNTDTTNGSRIKTLDPGNRLPSLSTTVSMATAESDRPLSHIQTSNTMPPGTQNNFKTFGVPLEGLVEFEQDMVPAIVRQCIYVVDKYGLDLEGIYRKSANVLDVSKLKEDIDRDPSNVAMISPPKNYSETDIYLVGSLLKAFFAALPSSLLPVEIVPDIKTCLAISDEKTRKNYMHGLIYKLPDAQYWTLRALLFHLKRVAEHEPKNRMNLKALNIIWGPTIIPPDNDEPNNVNFQIGAMEVLLDVADQAFEAD